MAIAFDVATDGGSTTGTSLTFSHTCTGSDLVLFVGILSAVGADNVTGVTYSGVAMTRVEIRNEATPNRVNYLYMLVGPATGANNVVISSGSSQFIAGVAASYTGAAQSGQPDANTNNYGAGAGSPFATSLASVADNCWHILCATQNAGAITGAGAGTTQRILQSDYLGLYDANSAKTPPGSVTLNVTLAATANISTTMASFAPAGGSVANHSLLMGV